LLESPLQRPVTAGARVPVNVALALTNPASLVNGRHSMATFTLLIAGGFPALPMNEPQASRGNNQPGGREVAKDTSSARDSARNAIGSQAAAPADLTVERILSWADAFHAANGLWPSGRVDSGSGPVEGAPGETWQGINRALVVGGRGLPGDSSLAELLAEHRGVPLSDMGPKALADKIWAWEQEQFPVRRPRRRTQVEYRRPTLTIAHILTWADAHHRATGEWPNNRMGLVQGIPFEFTWRVIDSSLARGLRGLPGASSLAQLLDEHRDMGPPLTVEQILEWADAHHTATGHWPTFTSGPVRGAEDENWARLDTLLRTGGRGLRRGLSLLLLLEKHRGVRAERKGRHVIADGRLLDAPSSRSVPDGSGNGSGRHGQG
jgi:hypothetical protein